MTKNFSFTLPSEINPELLSRSIIEIGGEDRKKFLQGLITNDVNKVNSSSLLYSAILNAQGRFLYDVFIHEKNDVLVLDVDASRRDEIFKKLNFYKLRSQVSLSKNDAIKVFSSFGNNSSDTYFIDPRSSAMGFRFYSSSNEFSFSNEAFFYNLTRIANKIAESESDLTYEKSFILEFAFDKLNAVSFEKGCYVGQELTARTHFKGEIRKKLFHIKIVDLNVIEKNREIACQGKSCGQILSSAFWQNELHALAILKAPENGEYESLFNHLELSENSISESLSSSKKIFIVS